MDLKIGDSVRLKYHGQGVAYRIVAYPQIWDAFTSLETNPDTGEEFEVDNGEGEWRDDDSGEQFVIVMVGDDHKETVDAEDLEYLPDSEFCGCCGQIGCLWGAAED